MTRTLPGLLREQAARLAALGVADDVRAVLEGLAEYPVEPDPADLGALGPLRLYAVSAAFPRHAVLVCPDCGGRRISLVEHHDVRWQLAVEPAPAGWQLVAHAHTRTETPQAPRQAACGRCGATWKIDDLPVVWR